MSVGQAGLSLSPYPWLEEVNVLVKGLVRVIYSVLSVARGLVSGLCRALSVTGGSDPKAR